MHAVQELATSDTSLANGAASASSVACTGEEEDDEGVLPYRGGRESIGTPDKGIRRHAIDATTVDQCSFDGPATKGAADDEPMFYLLSISERHQRPLPSLQRRMLWARSQQQRADGSLLHVKAGRAGLTPQLLGVLTAGLRSRELLQLDALPASQLAPKFLAFVLPEMLDCAVVRTHGRSVTLFRDSSLPLPRPTTAGIPAF